MRYTAVVVLYFIYYAVDFYDKVRVVGHRIRAI